MRESLIAFVNLSTAPGLAGATFTVDEPGRRSDLVRGSLGYASDLTLKDYVLDAYWGAALAYGGLEVTGQYTAAYTDTFNGTIDNLDTWGWNETALARVRYSKATGWHTRNKPWRWNTYATHTRFLGLEQQALGFNTYSEIGVGLDFELNIRPLDWFGLRFLGLKAGYIFGDGVKGVSVGLSF